MSIYGEYDCLQEHIKKFSKAKERIFNQDKHTKYCLFKPAYDADIPNGWRDHFLLPDKFCQRKITFNVESTDCFVKTLSFVNNIGRVLIEESPNS